MKIFNPLEDQMGYDKTNLVFDFISGEEKIRVDMSKAKHDFDPNRENIKDYLSQFAPAEALEFIK